MEERVQVVNSTCAMDGKKVKGLTIASPLSGLHVVGHLGKFDSQRCCAALPLLLELINSAKDAKTALLEFIGKNRDARKR